MDRHIDADLEVLKAVAWQRLAAGGASWRCVYRTLIWPSGYRRPRSGQVISGRLSGYVKAAEGIAGATSSRLPSNAMT